MNVANVDGHKIFAGSQVSLTKKKNNNEKGRFGELSTQEIKEIMDKAVPETKKKPQRLGSDYLTVSIR